MFGQLLFITFGNCSKTSYRLSISLFDFLQSVLRSMQSLVRVVHTIGTAFPTWNIATRPSMQLLPKTQEPGYIWVIV